MAQHDTDLLEYPARGGADDRVHLVAAGLDALLDPSPYRTRCGQAVLEVYNTRLAATCPTCQERTPEPSESRVGTVTSANLRTAETSTAIPRDPGRVAAAIVAVVLLTIGILGFVPGVTSDYPRLVHLAFGVVGLAMATTGRSARAFLVAGGLTYLMLWLNTADNWLHLFLAAGLLGLGFMVGTPRRPTNTPMRESAAVTRARPAGR